MKLSLCITALTICAFWGFSQNAEIGTNERINQILQRIQLPELPENTFNIVDFGAVSDGKTNCKPAIDAAVKKASAEGGGKIVFPAGTWFCKGPIHFESKINLHLEEGCVVLFSDNAKDYLPLQLVRWEGVEIYNFSPYIYAINKTDIAITGKGKFDGNAAEFRKWRAKQKPAQNKVRQMGHELVPTEKRIFGEDQFLRFSFFQPMNCKNILIEGITIENVPFWVMHPTYCKNITISNVTVNSPHINNDGIDFDSCEDALVKDCIFTCGDDAIVIKSGRDEDAWRVNKPSKNIVIQNCYAPEVLHGLAFGSEMSGGVENIFIDNFYMKNVQQYAIQFKANKDRGGYIKNVFIDGVFIDKAKTAVYFTNDYHSYSGGNSPSEFSFIDIENVWCNQTEGKGIDIQGLPEKPIHHVTVKNVKIVNEIEASAAVNFKNGTFKNIVVNGSLVGF